MKALVYTGTNASEIRDVAAPVAADLAAVSALFSRVVAYVDDGHRPRRGR